MKGKFDFKELMVQRGEIFAMGAVLLIVGYFVFDAFGHGVLDQGNEPINLRNDIDLAKEVIKGSKPPPIPVVKADMTFALTPSTALTPRVLTPREFESKRPRGEPTYFTIEGPRACAGIGPFAVKSVRGAKEPEGVTYRDLARDRKLPGFQANERSDARLMRYIVITAVVPTFKQQADFDSKFKGAVLPEGHDPGKDVLEFAQPLIERAEWTAAGAAALNWAPLSRKDISRGLQGDPDWVTARGGRDSQSIGAAAMDPKFFHPILTSPLGPLLMKDWTEDCVLHAPEIPMLVAETPADANIERVDDGRPELKGFDEVPEEPDKQVTEPTDPSAVVQHQLFRFFDYTVEPGKSYVYRVKLYMRNPNFKILPRFLTLEAAAAPRTPGRYSDSWSQSIPPVRVPITSEVLAGTLKRGALGDDRARMMVIDRNSVTGLEGHKEMTRRVGHLAHFPLAMDVNATVEDAWYVDPDEPDVRHARKRKPSWFLAGEVLVLDPLRQKIRVEPTFTSDVALLDARGGTGDEPAEILVMDALGNLSAHHAADDHAEFQRRNAYVSASGIEEPESNGSTSRFGP